ncbi:phosphoethanolamine transferase [Thalassospira lucentensis]|uniref:phosphoethanolamine transferase n=1 Tax=Thalassospira lucentensis TaxID=168935 RepID=UPI003D2F2AE3
MQNFLKSQFLRRGRDLVFDYRVVLCLITVYFILVFNWKVLGHFYAILGGLEAFDPVFAASAPFVLFFGLMAIFPIFSFRPFFKPFFVFLILTSAVVSFAMTHYGIVFDRSMITNFAETNPSEAASYLNVRSVLLFAVTGMLPVGILAFMPVRYAPSFLRGLGQKMLIVVISLSCLGGIGFGYFKDYASVGRNNKILGKEVVPVNYIAASIQYAKHRLRATQIPFRTIGNDARMTPTTGKPTLMFLVVGETARAASVAANGYDRPTSEFTGKIPDLVAFQNVTSCGTATAVSVPCMFSPMTHSTYNEGIADNSENLLDVLAKAGVDVFWNENDGGCKGVCDRIANRTISDKEFPGMCAGGLCFDETMIDAVGQELGAETGAETGDEKGDVGKDRLIVLHLNGSHGPTYYERYPDNFRHFMPDCQQSDIENCTQQELVNTYDNTIRYTDFVIARLVDALKEQSEHYNTALLYVSDHGESLGESGLYLHGAPYFLAPAEQTHVPMMFWMSSGLAQDQKIDRGCLDGLARTGAFSHDNLFSTTLGLMQVETSIYDRTSDILAACVQKGDRYARR